MQTTICQRICVVLVIFFLSNGVYNYMFYCESKRRTVVTNEIYCSIRLSVVLLLLYLFQSLVFYLNLYSIALFSRRNKGKSSFSSRLK